MILSAIAAKLKHRSKNDFRATRLDELLPSGDGRLAVGWVKVPMLAWNWS